MTKGVFVIRSDSPYDDQPETHYQFPAQYLSLASQESASVGQQVGLAELD